MGENVVDFILEWYHNWENMDQSKIEKIYNENHDCHYSGQVFRFLKMHFSEYEPYIKYTEEKEYEITDMYGNSTGEVEMVPFATDDDVKTAIKQAIRNNNLWKSWAKTMEGIEVFAVESLKFDYEEPEDGIILVGNIEGLDLTKLCEKYKDLLEEAGAVEQMKQIEYTEEVISKSNNFDIYGEYIWTKQRFELKRDLSRFDIMYIAHHDL